MPAGGRGRPTRARAAQIAERRAEALALKVQGLGNREIAEVLGYSSADRVSEDISRALTNARGRADQAATELADLHERRLECLLRAAWTKAIQGDVRAIDAAIRVLERQAKLRSLDGRPSTREPSDAEFEAALQEIALAIDAHVAATDAAARRPRDHAYPSPS